MTIVTLPREVVQQALDALDGLFKANDYGSGGVAVWRLGGSYAPREAIASLRTALDAPAQPVDCRGCTYFRNGLVGRGCYVSLDEGKRMLCTNGDKFKPLPTIQLYKQEK